VKRNPFIKPPWSGKGTGKISTSCLGFVPLGPGFFKGNADGVAVPGAVAPDDLGGGVPAAARAERRKEQRKRFVVIERFLRDRPHAALRNVQDVKADQPARVVFGCLATDSVNGNPHNGAAMAPSLIRRIGWCQTHWPPAVPCEPLALPSSKVCSPTATSSAGIVI